MRGSSDDWVCQTAEGTTYWYDLHATILHLVGTERRLTDGHGCGVTEILS